MQKIVSIKYPKYNNIHSFCRYGKDNLGYQKYQCKNCFNQFSRERQSTLPFSKYPLCPRCGKAHSYTMTTSIIQTSYVTIEKIVITLFLSLKILILSLYAISPAWKNGFSRIRFPTHIIISALSMTYLRKSTLRNISFMLRPGK